MKKRHISTAILLSAALLATASLEKAQAAPKKVVSLFNWSDYIGVNTIKNFEKESGYKVNYDTYESTDAAEAKFMTGNMGYDAVVAEASSMPHLLPLGIFATLDKSKIPNWKNIDPAILKLLEKHDPGNQHMVPHFRSFTGFTYDRDRLAKIMPDAPIDSAKFLFDPAVISKFKSCGVSFMDSSLDVFALALMSVGMNPNAKSVAELKIAADLVYKVRPFIRGFDSANYLNAIANRELCVVMTWSGDYAVAQERAAKSGKKINFGYTIPKEGAMLTLDGWLVSATAPNLEGAYAFLNFNLQGKIAADNVNTVKYGTTNIASLPYIDKALMANPAISPTPEMMARAVLFDDPPQELTRIRSKMWQRLKANTYSPKQVY